MDTSLECSAQLMNIEVPHREIESNVLTETPPQNAQVRGNRKKATFVDAELISRYGTFNIRVYKETSGHETVVFWPREIPLEEPVLVRVHSECLTGDVLGSLHCDCGQQLVKSLRLIGQQGGVLIYLRQEGRGIGLFEKIKSYRLQAQGYDTFEANLMLGHNPDTRTYEMVKVALKDLGINRIRLLTNNPSKVSDISSLGISISEVVKLAIKPCKHNRKYLLTKKQKFSHFLLGENARYQYQFYASNAQCVHEIGLFLRDQTLDPFLQVCVAITLDHAGLCDPNKLLKIEKIIEACEAYPAIQPVLHFSCKKPDTWLADLKGLTSKIKGPYKIQINDLKLDHVCELEWLLSSKKVDVAISSENFNLISKQKNRRILLKHNCLVVLDDSKGRGKPPTERSLHSKVDKLLKYGINRIGLAGGFGPDALDLYFRLKRYYRINFSIDSETGVKTGRETDTDKVKLYLKQLLRNDHPKEDGIQQTKNHLFKSRRDRWEIVQIGGQEFHIHPNVFHAGEFPSTAWFAKEISESLTNQSTFCEVGCGSGVISCLSAIANPSLKVVATDLNPDASENTKVNASFLGVTDRISVRQGDVLDAISSNERFDLIFWALPFGFLDPGASINLEEAQVFDPGYRAIRKLLYTAKQHLTSRGRLLLGFSSDLGHYDLLHDIAQEVHASIRTVAKTAIQEDLKLQFEILEITYLPNKIDALSLIKKGKGRS